MRRPVNPWLAFIVSLGVGLALAYFLLPPTRARDAAMASIVVIAVIVEMRLARRRKTSSH
jgi:hypothetical protein